MNSIKSHDVTLAVKVQTKVTVMMIVARRQSPSCTASAQANFARQRTSRSLSRRCSRPQSRCVKERRRNESTSVVHDVLHSQGSVTTSFNNVERDGVASRAEEHAKECKHQQLAQHFAVLVERAQPDSPCSRRTRCTFRRGLRHLRSAWISNTMCDLHPHGPNMRSGGGRENKIYGTLPKHWRPKHRQPMHRKPQWQKKHRLLITLSTSRCCFFVISPPQRPAT